MENADDASGAGKDVNHKFGGFLNWIELVLSAKLRDPLRMLGVVLVEYTIQLNNVPVNIEAYLNGVIHHQRYRNHIKSKVYHKGFKTKGAT